MAERAKKAQPGDAADRVALRTCTSSLDAIIALQKSLEHGIPPELMMLEQQAASVGRALGNKTVALPSRSEDRTPLLRLKRFAEMLFEAISRLSERFKGDSSGRSARRSA